MITFPRFVSSRPGASRDLASRRPAGLPALRTVATFLTTALLAISAVGCGGEQQDGGGDGGGEESFHGPGLYCWVNRSCISKMPSGATDSTMGAVGGSTS